MKRYSLYAVLCILIVSVLACTGTNVTPTPTKKSGNIVISTFTPAPTDAPTASPVPTADTSAMVQGVLPGISPANVTVSLEAQKFTCTIVKKGVVYYERTCTRGVPSVEVFHVVISGRQPFTVDFIEASILQYENPDIETAASILGLVASIPYGGATPEEARAWVESTIPALSGEPGGAQETVIGGVKYVLYGPPTALTLEMGELP